MLYFNCAVFDEALGGWMFTTVPRLYNFCMPNSNEHYISPGHILMPPSVGIL